MLIQPFGALGPLRVPQRSLRLDPSGPVVSKSKLSGMVFVQDAEGSTYSEAPYVNDIPTLGPKIHKYDLLWAI